jgi:hypothetical protein
MFFGLVWLPGSTPGESSGDHGDRPMPSRKQRDSITMAKANQSLDRKPCKPPSLRPFACKVEGNDDEPDRPAGRRPDWYGR